MAQYVASLLAPTPSGSPSISVSGLSSGADMAAQLLVAYSSLFAGGGIFAGGGGGRLWADQQAPI